MVGLRATKGQKGLSTWRSKIKKPESCRIKHKAMTGCERSRACVGLNVPSIAVVWLKPDQLTLSFLSICFCSAKKLPWTFSLVLIAPWGHMSAGISDR